MQGQDKPVHQPFAAETVTERRSRSPFVVSIGAYNLLALADTTEYVACDLLAKIGGAYDLLARDFITSWRLRPFLKIAITLHGSPVEL